MTLRFTPPPNSARYAVHVTNSSRSFRVFSNLGRAKQALRATTTPWGNAARHEGRLLEMVGGDWFVLYSVSVGDTEMPWVKNIESTNWHGEVVSTITKAVPMTREEYADWRIQVELERRGISA